MKKCTVTFLLLTFSFCAQAQYLNWVKQITGAQTNYVKGMAIDGSGNIYLTGAFTGTIDLDPGAGTVSVTAQGGYDIWFAKYTSAGAYVWHKIIGGGGDDWANDIALDGSGNIYIAGWFNSLAPALDFDPEPNNTVTFTQYDGGFVAKYNSSGAYVWRTVIGGTSSDVTKMNALAVDGSGNVYVAGIISGNNTPVDPGDGNPLNPSNGNIFYAKYNGSDGTVSWAKNTGDGNNTAITYDISLDASNNVYVSGVFSGTTDFNPDGSSINRTSSSGSAYVAKYNSSGAFSWSAQVTTGQNGDEAYKSVVDGSGNVFVTGKQNSNSQDIFLAKFNSTGTQQWKVAPGNASGEDQGQTMALDASGNVYMSGYFTGTGSNINFNPLGTAAYLTLTNGTKDFFMSKYNTSGILQWVRNLDVTLASGARQVNESFIYNGNLIIAGALNGTGDFNICSTGTEINAPTDNGFFGSYFALTPVISGASCIASMGTSSYTLQDIPPGVSVTWSVSPTNLFSGATSGTGTTATLTAAASASGSATLTFTFLGGTACSNSVSIDIWIGLTPSLSFTANYSMAHSSILLSTPYVGGGATAQWTINGVQHAGFDISVQPLCIENTTQELNISLTVANQCESKTVCNKYLLKCPPNPSLTYMSSCDGGGGGEEESMIQPGSKYSVWPNPARQIINITVVSNQGSDKTTDTTIQTIVLTDMNGAGEVFTGFSKENKEVRIDVSDLRKGTYILKISNAEYVETHRILIDR